MKKLTALLPLSISIATALATAAHAQATGLQWSLPPEEQVVKALDGHPTVEAAGKRVGAASAASDMLRVGPHEVQLTGSYINRDVRLERNYTEFDGTVSRSFRLPGKAALDREAGQLGVEVAQNRMEDTRHQAALYLSQLWYDWLTASELNRTDQSNVALLERGLAAVKRRVQLRDASMLDTDQAQAALDQAKGVAAASLADMEQARALLQSNFPDLALPPEAASLADPVLPSQDLTALHDLVIQRSHEIGAADREALRLEVVARRARADRLPDPQLGVRAFSERSGIERGVGVVFSIPLGGRYRKFQQDQAEANASAASMDLAQARRMVLAMADTDMANASGRYVAWQRLQGAARSSLDAATRTERGYEGGIIDLSDLLYSRRQAHDADRLAIDARSSATRAIVKLLIDSHTIWQGNEKEP